MEKKSLKQAATKEDLKRELAKLATKEELRAEVVRIEAGIESLRKEVDAKGELLRKEVNEKFTTKDEFRKFRDEVLTGQDKILTIVKRIDQERVFTAEWVRRIEGEVGMLKKDVEKIKSHLQLA